jgi:hypothetical protein
MAGMMCLATSQLVMLVGLRPPAPPIEPPAQPGLDREPAGGRQLALGVGGQDRVELLASFLLAAVAAVVAGDDRDAATAGAERDDRPPAAPATDRPLAQLQHDALLEQTSGILAQAGGGHGGSVTIEELRT